MDKRGDDRGATNARVDFDAQRAMSGTDGWSAARYHSFAAGESVRTYLSFRSVHEINPFEIAASHKAERAAYRAMRDDLFRLLDIGGLLGKPLIALSNGESRRVLLAHEALKSPSTLTICTPTGGLDPEWSDRLPDVVRFLRERGVRVRLKGGDRDADIRAWPAGGKLGTGKPVVEIRDLSLSLAGKRLFRHFDWTVREGERWILRGRNGSGKSTLFALIRGDSPLAYAHDIRVFGKRRTDGVPLGAIRGKIAMISPEMRLNGECDTATFLGDALKRRPKLLLLDEVCFGLGKGDREKVKSAVNDYLRENPRAAAICIAHHPSHVPDGFNLTMNLDTGDTLLGGNAKHFKEVPLLSAKTCRA